MNSQTLCSRCSHYPKSRINCKRCKVKNNDNTFKSYTKLPSKKIPKKILTKKDTQSSAIAKKNGSHEVSLADTVQGWQCKTILDTDENICKKTFLEKEAVIAHINKDHPSKIGKICKVLIKKKLKVDTNQNPKIKPSTVEVKKDCLRCVYCTFKSDDIDILQDHITSQHDEIWMTEHGQKIKNDNKNFQYKCMICSMKTRSFDSFKLHLKMHSSSQRQKSCLRIQSSSMSPPQSTLTKKKSRTTTLSCFFCSLAFSSVSELTTHLREYHKIQTNSTINRIISTCHGNQP